MTDDAYKPGDRVRIRPERIQEWVRPYLQERWRHRLGTLTLVGMKDRGRLAYVRWDGNKSASAVAWSWIERVPPAPPAADGKGDANVHKEVVIKDADGGLRTVSVVLTVTGDEGLATSLGRALGAVVLGYRGRHGERVIQMREIPEGLPPAEASDEQQDEDDSHL